MDRSLLVELSGRAQCRAGRLCQSPDRTGSFADPAFITAGEQLQQLIDLEPFQEGYLEQGYGDQQVVIAKGRTAMELMGQWAFGADSAVAEENLENYVANISWFPFPMVDGGAGQPKDAFGGGDGFAIGKNAPPETIDFVKFLTNKEHQSHGREGPENCRAARG